MTSADTLDAIESLASTWSTDRADRMARRHLDRADFEALAETGYLRLIVPREHGGEWDSLAETGPVIVDAVRRLARGDQSVALVAAMHPAVVVFWTGAPEAPAPHTEAWRAQRAEVFRSALDGHFWGTVTSEPGSGGDILKTRATATPIDAEAGRYSLHGQKHFGSGSEVVSYMMTTAKPEGLDFPFGFYMDLRNQPWDGSGGLTITHRWDGVGMKATQSHGVLLDGVEGIAWAWPGSIANTSAVAGALGLGLFVAVIESIVDAAMAEADAKLNGQNLRPYEEVEWTRAQVDHWLIRQASAGLVRSITTAPAPIAALAAVKAKLGVAALAEELLTRVSKVVGGSAFSERSPFAAWYQDVRALGYLRPPWGLAFDQLIAARRSQA